VALFKETTTLKRITLLLVVGISDLIISTEPDDVLVTYSLGSCAGITLYDSRLMIGGLIHCMLPLSSTDLKKAESSPFMFVDTGLQLMLQKLFDMGATKGSLVAKVAGAASILDPHDYFKIGQRNYTTARKLLWKNNILIKGEDVGGNKARTMYLYMKTGETRIRSAGEEAKL
jgi:chemotaxis protein CheD